MHIRQLDSEAMGARKKPTAADVKWASDLAQVSEFCDKLPEGMETLCAGVSPLSGYNLPGRDSMKTLTLLWG